MDLNAQQPQQSVNPQPIQPQMGKPVQNSSPLPKILLTILGIVLILSLVGGAYYLGTQKSNSNNASEKSALVSPTTPVTISPSNTPTTVPTKTAQNPTCVAADGWSVYTSNTEKACFTYPKDWTVIKPTINYLANADYFSVQSPSGEIKVNWVSVISGLGGGCNANAPLGDANGCPLITVIDKTTIKNASGLYVISGTVTKDGKLYEPWLAVQDGTGLLTTRRSMSYDIFMGKNNGSLPILRGINATAIFSTSDAYARGPDLSQSDAAAWFNKPEVQQAKQVLLSLTY